MNPNVRRSDETQQQFKESLRRENQKQGYVRMLWNSSAKGTYVKAKHGPLTK